MTPLRHHNDDDIVSDLGAKARIGTRCQARQLAASYWLVASGWQHACLLWAPWAVADTAPLRSETVEAASMRTGREQSKHSTRESQGETRR